MSSQLSDFSFYFPVRILYGIGKFRALGQEVSSLGKRAMIVTYPPPYLDDLTDRARQLLEQAGVEAVLFRKAEANPTDALMDEGGRLARASGCDVVIGLGGGSSMDVAKGIAVVATENVPIWSIVEGAPITQPALPMVAVPTTAGTGSEATHYTVISNRAQQRKEGIARDQFYPRVSIVDPLLTVSMPPSVTAQTGLDVLVHGIEAYVAKVASPISDVFATEAIRLCSENLRRATYSGQDLSARSNMMMASTLAGIAITLSDTSLAHVIGEAVGAVFNTPHGLTVALCLPAVMEFTCVANLGKFARITELMGGKMAGQSTRAAALASADLVRQLIIDLGQVRGLSALGVAENAQVMKLVTRPGWDASSARSASPSDFEVLIRACLRPEMSYWSALDDHP